MKTTHRLKTHFAVSALSGLIVTAPGALAEGAGSATALLEEVFVTAQKRGPQDVQDVPIAVSAFGPAQLEAKFITNIEDLSFSVPNASLGQVGTTPGVATFSIRGLGINSSQGGVDPTVGVFVDGIYLGSTYGVVLDTFDLAGVEVLRGPQGVLFGRNVTGGAVVMRTARPTGEFGAKVRTRITTSEDGGIAKNMAGSIEGALTDTLAVKASALWNDDDGWYKNQFNDDDFGAEETKVIRPSMVWTPTDELSVAVLLEYGETTGDGGAYQNRGTAIQAVAQKDQEINIDYEGFTDIRWRQAIVEVNWDIGNGTLTNIMGYRDVDHEGGVDIDGTPSTLFNAILDTEQDQFSNELRYATTIGDSWDITGGLYYFTQNLAYYEKRDQFYNGTQPIFGGDMDHKTWGVFLNNDYHLNDAITLTAGARYTYEKKDVAITTAVAPIGCNISLQCTPDQVEDEDWSNVTPKLGAQWLINDDVQAYVTWSKGFRSGGYNFRSTDPTFFAPNAFDEEELDSYELGIKSTLLEGKLRVNAALFRTEIADIQRIILLPDGPSLKQGIENAGDVTIDGLEIDFVALLSDNFSINGSLGLMDGEYDKVTFDLNADGVINSADKDLDLPLLAENNWSLGAAYDIAIGNAGGLTLRVDYSHRDEVAYSDSNETFLPEVDMVDASARYNLTENASISLYGKNLKNEAIVNAASPTGFGELGAVGKGRIYGLEFNYQF